MTQLVQLRHYKLRANGAWTVERPQCAAAVQKALTAAAAQPEVEW